MDFSATGVAQFAGVRRKAVTLIFFKVRQRIAGEYERASPFSGGVEVDECYSGVRLVRGKRAALIVARLFPPPDGADRAATRGEKYSTFPALPGGESPEGGWRTG